MITVQRYVSGVAKYINPVSWNKLWKNLENKSPNQVADQCIQWGDHQISKLHYIYERGGHRSLWWSTPLGYVLMVYLTYKSYQMVWITRKQKKAAQLVAAAYGQGGQWLNPVPR